MNILDAVFVPNKGRVYFNIIFNFIIYYNLSQNYQRFGVLLVCGPWCHNANLTNLPSLRKSHPPFEILLIVTINI